MACMKIGSKSDMFYLDGQTWLCSTGLASDIRIEIGEISFHLHKFPLISRSKLLEKMIKEIPENKKWDWGGKSVLELNDIPGGENSFLLVAKFCYGVKINLNLTNVVSLRCAANYLQMTEDYGEGNLTMQTENFLDEVFRSWADSIKAIEACGEVLSNAEELHIVSRGIDSLATKACVDPNLFSWRISDHGEPPSPAVDIRNGIQIIQKPLPLGDEWWYEDVCFLKLPLYRRFILAVYAKGMAPLRIAGSLMCYAGKHLPMCGRESGLQIDNQYSSGTYEADQRTLLEEIAELLPIEKGANSSKFLLKLLRTSIILQARGSCKERLEKMIGMQLNEAALEDLLIPNMDYSGETLYDIDCMHRMVDHFMLADEEIVDSASNYLVEEDEYEGDSRSLTPITMVAKLVDNYLAEVAPDVNLKLFKFQSLAAIIPGYARVSDDGLYRAIDIYLKAHTCLTDSEREQLCRIMNCQKLSVEASSHAAQNERLPLRVIVQVLFFEQLRLRTSVSGLFFASEELDNSRNPIGSKSLARTSCTIQQENSKQANKMVTVENVRERLFEPEQKCSIMKQEIDKLMKTKGSWNTFFGKFGLRLKMRACDLKAPTKPGKCRVKLPVSRNAVMDKKQNGANNILANFNCA
ncbi:hypothetical protein LIER_19504 [Lithospermum erythrorhizon]|uniref:Phototropic-responsive NPH3 family protein n=1 Tax=Lithospermum erythrorhizon TaxID=34254 RepID=A0AAV3QI19_LITER